MMGASGAGVGAQRLVTPTPRHFFYAGEDPAIQPVPVRIIITIDSYELGSGTYPKQISADINGVHYVQEPDDLITIVIESNKDGLVNGKFQGTLSVKPFGGSVIRKAALTNGIIKNVQVQY